MALSEGTFESILGWHCCLLLTPVKAQVIQTVIAMQEAQAMLLAMLARLQQETPVRLATEAHCQYSILGHQVSHQPYNRISLSVNQSPANGTGRFVF